jgi:hypothetical protein
MKRLTISVWKALGKACGAEVYKLHETYPGTMKKRKAVKQKF